jgi:hypothetical protein
VSFNVRIFGHRGTRQLRQLIPQQFTSNITESLAQPYDWMQVVTTNGATPVSTIIVGPALWGFVDLANVIRIEVPSGQVIRYEFNSPQRFGAYATNGVVTLFSAGVVAGSNSPSLSGSNIFDWQLGTTISIVEAASFP